MTDPTNDIDALLALFERMAMSTNGSLFKRRHAALTALVADRNALLAWRSEMTAKHAHLGQSYTMLAEENAILRERLKSHPSAERGWEGLFKVSEPVSPKTTAPIHREPSPTPAPPPKKCCKEGNQSC